MKRTALILLILFGFSSVGIAQTYTPPQPKTPAATETGSGVVELATDAETVTGTATDKVTTPANITAKMSAPGAIGGTTPSTGAFTNITVTETTTAAGGRTGVYSYLTHNTNALTGNLIGARGNARVDTIDSAAGTVTGGKFQAGNMGTGTDLLTATGVYVDVVNKIPSGATTWTNARGYEVSMDLDQGSAGNVNTVTNAYMFYGVYNLPTVDAYATVTNGYGIFVRNEAVGGTGQMLDAAFYADDLSHSGGIYGWDFGIDFSGITSGAFGTADIRGVNGETISNNTDGLWILSGNVISGTPTMLASELNDTSDPHTLIVSELKNTILTNSESTGADEWDFPARTEGWSFIFIIEAAQNITLDPNGTEQWYLNGTQLSAGEAIVNSAPTVGESIMCYSTESNVFCESDDADWQEETP